MKAKKFLKLTLVATATMVATATFSIPATAQIGPEASVQEVKPPAAAQASKVKPNWKLAAKENFSGNRLNTKRWTPFTGHCGCTRDTLWDPSQVQVKNGTLRLHNKLVNGRWLSGGVGGWNSVFEQKYGKVSARLRYERGTGHMATALMWGEGSWPTAGELDFYEIFETWGKRDQMRQTLHHGPSVNGGSQQITKGTIYKKWYKWHRAGVAWTPYRVTYFVDGKPTHTVRKKNAIPETMWTGFQNHVKRVNGVWPRATSKDGRVTFEIDWVKIYKSRWS